MIQDDILGNHHTASFPLVVRVIFPFFGVYDSCTADCRGDYGCPASAEFDLISAD